MRWLFVIVALLSMQLEAADFRMSNFGDSCALLAEREAALGSTPVPWGGPPKTQAFKTRMFGHDVAIVYLCVNGAVHIGNYFFPKQTREAAVETLRAVYEDFVSTYGAPSLDSSPWQSGEAFVDPRSIVEPGYMASWRTPRLVLTTTLVTDGDEAGPNWKVMAVFHGAHHARHSVKRSTPAPRNVDPLEGA